MFLSWINEDRVIWFSLTVSILLHLLILTHWGHTFIRQPQFSVRPSAQMVEVSIEENSVALLVPSNDANRTMSKDARLKPFEARKPLMTPTAQVKVEAKPDYIQNPPPPYPELAKQMRQEGLVRLSVDVDRQGDPVNIEIIQSSGFRLLDQAALKAVRHWKFQPGSIAGITVESTVTLPIRFRLEK